MTAFFARNLIPLIAAFCATVSLVLWVLYLTSGCEGYFEGVRFATVGLSVVSLLIAVPYSAVKGLGKISVYAILVSGLNIALYLSR